VVVNTNIAWAAGLIEGEGCFTSHTNSPYFLMDSTDEDVLRKFQVVFPFTTFRGPYNHQHKEHYKPRWRVDAFGPKAVIVMEAVYDYMGTRRKEKIDQLLKAYKEKL